MVKKRPAAATPMKRPAARSYPTGGGPHAAHVQSAASYEAALKCAVEKHQKEEVPDFTHVSKFTLAVELEEGWRSATSSRTSYTYSCTSLTYRLDLAKYARSVSPCFGIEAAKVVAKERGFLVSITYNFPASEEFFQNRRLADWVRAIEAVLRRRAGGLYEANLQDGSPTTGSLPRLNLAKESGTFSVEVEVWQSREMRRMGRESREERAALFIEVAPRTDDIADALVFGGRCCRCPRRAISHGAGAGACCWQCKNTGGHQHAPDCPEEQPVTPAQSADFEVAKKMAVAAGPRACLLVETQVEVQAGALELTAEHLATIARGMGSSSVELEGVITTAPTLGRFAFDHAGSERVACSLCGSRAMVKWCWHDHALSPEHMEKHDAAVLGAQVEMAPDPFDLLEAQYEHNRKEELKRQLAEGRRRP